MATNAFMLKTTLCAIALGGLFPLLAFADPPEA